MSTTPAERPTTTTVGYFNARQHRIHVVVARYNMTLELAPGEYVLDSKGRRINDPFFDGYTCLSKETSPTPVPLIRLATPQPAAANQRYDGHSVRQVTEFEHDARGVRRPVMPQRAVIPAPADPNQPSIRSMTVEEARRLGLIRQTRAVPEDYGVTDTDGAPPSGAPPIKLATDLPPRNQATTSTSSGVHRAIPKVPAVPQPKAQVPVQPVEEALPLPDVDGVPAAYDDGLSAPEIENPLSTANAANLMAQAAVAAPAIPPLVKALPAYEDEESAPAPESEPVIVDHGPDVVQPAEPVAEAAVAAVAPPVEEELKFVCAADGRRFGTYGKLAEHVRKNFKDLKVVRQLLAPYASARPAK